jgi:hypothetical protein
VHKIQNGEGENLSEDANYYELNPGESLCRPLMKHYELNPEENLCRALVKYEPPSETYWTLDDLRFLHACGISHE